jgi:hypothetical protein
MTPIEKEQYQKHFGTYQLGMKKLGIRMNYHGAFRRLIMMSVKSSIAAAADLLEKHC